MMTQAPDKRNQHVCHHTGSKSADYVFVNHSLLVGASLIYSLTLRSFPNIPMYLRQFHITQCSNWVGPPLLVDEASSSRWGGDLPNVSGQLGAAGPVLTPQWNSCPICLPDICSTTEQASLCLSVSDTCVSVTATVTIRLVYTESLCMLAMH